MKEALKEVRITYTIEHEGRYFVIENVPARICEKTGDELFTPETVEHIQNIIKSDKPLRIMETPVYEYN